LEERETECGVFLDACDGVLFRPAFGKERGGDVSFFVYGDVDPGGYARGTRVDVEKFVEPGTAYGVDIRIRPKPLHLLCKGLHRFYRGIDDAAFKAMVQQIGMNEEVDGNADRLVHLGNVFHK